MGYHVTILRTRRGTENPLRADEVRALTTSFPNVRIEDSSLIDGDLDLVVLHPGAHPLRLVLQHGRLWAKNPSDFEITTMVAIAAHLGARVRGEELETYRSATDTYLDPDDEEEQSRVTSVPRRGAQSARTIPMMIKIVAVLVLLIGLLVSYLRGG